MASHMELKRCVSETLGGNEDVMLWKMVSNDLNMCGMTGLLNAHTWSSIQGEFPFQEL